MNKTLTSGIGFAVTNTNGLNINLKDNIPNPIEVETRANVVYFLVASQVHPYQEKFIEPEDGVDFKDMRSLLFIQSQLIDQGYELDPISIITF